MKQDIFLRIGQRATRSLFTTKVHGVINTSTVRGITIPNAKNVLNKSAGFSGGKRFRSAAEFLPHASWLTKGGANPSTLCGCNLCLKAHAKSAGGVLPPPSKTPQIHPGALSEERASESCSQPSPSSIGDDRASMVSLQPPPMDGVRKSGRRLATRIPRADSTRTSRAVAYFVRASTPVGVSTPQDYPPPTGPWPVLHELVWCKLRKPIESSGTAIDFWPGIIKRHEERFAGTVYHVSLLGNKHDIAFTINHLLPYQAYRMDGAMVQELRRRGVGRRRIALLDLEKVTGTELDDSRFSVISSTCIFALTFSQQLSAVWSCTSDPEPRRPSASTYQLQEEWRPETRQRSRKKQYSTLWWGPERIRLQQIVRLKISLPSVRFDRQILNARFTPGPKESGPTTLLFLKIRSIFFDTPEARDDGPGTNPSVSGALFGLVSDADQRGASLRPSGYQAG